MSPETEAEQKEILKQALELGFEEIDEKDAPYGDAGYIAYEQVTKVGKSVYKISGYVRLGCIEATDVNEATGEETRLVCYPLKLVFGHSEHDIFKKYKFLPKVEDEIPARNLADVMMILNQVKTNIDSWLTKLKDLTDFDEHLMKLKGNADVEALLIKGANCNMIFNAALTAYKL
jgi:hypothetical protein